MPDPILDAFAPVSVSRSTSSPDEERSALLRLLIQGQFPQRLQALYSRVPAVQAQATGSPEAMQSTLAQKLQQLAEILQQATASMGRSLGPLGGNQIPAAMGQARSGIAQQVLPLFLQALRQGQQGMQDIATGTSLIVPGGQVSRGSRELQGGDPLQTASGILNVAGLFKKIYNAWPSSGTPAGSAGFSTIGSTPTIPQFQLFQ